MLTSQSIPYEQRPTPVSIVNTELGSEQYINSVISIFPSLLSPVNDFGYDSHAPRITLANKDPPSATEIITAIGRSKPSCVRHAG